MAKIKNSKISFSPSASEDVIGYKIYIVLSGTSLDYNSESFDLGNATMADLYSIVGDRDGIFDIGITAVDDAGNESDMSVANNIPLDFVAPASPGMPQFISL